MWKKWVGYYYAQGRYGDFDPFENCTVLSLDNFADGAGILPTDGAARLRNAARYTGAIFLGADQASMAAMKADWGLVAGLVLTEYGNDRLDALDLAAAAARTRVAEWGLAQRPVIATVMPDQLFQPGWRMPNVDWLAVEIYFDLPAADRVTQQLAVSQRVAQVLAAIPADVGVVLIGQAYDRSRAAWQARPDLIAAQVPVLASLIGPTRMKGIWWFAYARPGGAKTYPEVEAACTAVATAAERPAILALPGPHRELTILSFDANGVAPFTSRAVAAIVAGPFTTLVWRWRRAGDPVWEIAAVNPGTDPDHHFRFTMPGRYEISLRGEYDGGATETGALRIVTVAPQPTTDPGPTPEGPKTMKTEDLPTYDQFLGEEGAAIDAAVYSSTRRQIMATEIRHNGWRRLRENWSQANILRSIRGQEPLDLEANTPDFPGTPTYDELLHQEGPQVDDAIRRRHGRKGTPGDIRHNLIRRLVEGWTQDNLLKDIMGEPNDGATLQRPAAGGIQVGTFMLPQRSGLVRPYGSSGIQDDGGPFLAIGASLFWALWAFVNDRDKLEKNLAFLAGRVHYIRVFAAVGPSGGWADRTVNPRQAGFQDGVAGLTDMAFDRFGLRIEWTIFAGVDNVPTQAERIDVLGQVIAATRGREHKVIHFEVANEAGLNGFDGPQGVKDIRQLGRMLRENTPNLVALSAPGSDQQGIDWYEGGPANLATIHPDRSQNGTGGMWRPVRQPWDVHFQGGIPKLRSLNEPIGPKSSVAWDADPLRLTMLAANGWTTGSALFVLHTGAGVRGGGAVDLGTGKGYLPRPADIWDVENIDAILNGLDTVAQLLPGDMPNWGQHNGNTKFPDYPFAVEPLMKEDDILRAYAAVGGGQFVVVPIQVMAEVPFMARRRMHVAVFDPMSGAELQQADLDAGQTIWLKGTKGEPTAFILKGEYR